MTFTITLDTLLLALIALILLIAAFSDSVTL